MKKYPSSLLTALAIVFCIGTLSSCAGRPKFIPQPDRENRDQEFERVLSAIQNEDVVYLESLFSKKALAETGNFIVGLQRLFAFFDGEILSYEFVAAGTDDEKSNGMRITKKRWWYSVSTSTGEYLFFFLEYPRDEENPDNVGMYMLQVIKSEDQEALFDIGQTILYPGVYVPDEYFEDK